MAEADIDIITVAEAREALNDDHVDTSDTTEVELYIGAVSRFIDWHYGPVIQRTVTEIHDGGCPSFWLAERPVHAVTTVTVDGTVLDTAYWHADRSINDPTLRSGKISHLASGRRGGRFNDGIDNVEVAFTAGRYANRAAMINDHAGNRWRQAAIITFQHAFAAEQRSVITNAAGYVVPASRYPASWDLMAVRDLLAGQRRNRRGFA